MQIQAHFYATSFVKVRTNSSIVTEESQNEEGRVIDLNKYEGHTPAPWKRAKAQITTQFCGDEIIVNTGGTSWEADMYLIADAPLLLAEVKRLRDRNKVLQDALDEVVQLSYNNYHNVLKTVHLSQPPED